MASVSEWGTNSAKKFKVSVSEWGTYFALNFILDKGDCNPPLFITTQQQQVVLDLKLRFYTF